MTVIFHRHFREVGYCNRGMRELCRRENIDWPDFVRNGIPADRLRALNNAMVNRVIDSVEKGGHGQ